MKNYDLEEAARQYRDEFLDKNNNDISKYDIEDIFIAGAEWQYDQFENNRLATCDNMTKAEQYIKDFTRGCSNELDNGEYEYWLTPWQAEAACNLKKEETIEKACEWLENHNDYQRVLDNGKGVRFDMTQCVTDFRKAMEE